MASIKPFKGIRYNAKKVKDLSRVVAPPYDVIPPKMQDELYRKNPHNIVRLILNKIKDTDTKDDNRYIRSKRFFESWIKDEVLSQDERPALYVYSQEYREGLKSIKRIGFIGLMKIDMGKKTTILPHENTLLAPKLDRLNLMKSVKANLSPIFVLYEDKPHKILDILKKISSKDKPLINVRFDNTTHKVWAVLEARLIKKIEEIMDRKDIFIADGHHRYEVARTYAIEVRDKPAPASLKKNSEFVMAYFVEMNEGMLTVLPTHRVIKDIGPLSEAEMILRLKTYFDIEKVSGLNNLTSRLHALRGSSVFGMYAGKGAFHILRLKSYEDADAATYDKPMDWKRLDVTILYSFILARLLGIRDDDENIEYLKDLAAAVRAVDAGKFRLAFFLNPTKVSQVKRIAELGERMPKKATYFYPKPLSGLIINKF